MPVMPSNTGSPASSQARHPRGEEGERLLQLDAREVGADAEVHAGAERRARARGRARRRCRTRRGPRRPPWRRSPSGRSRLPVNAHTITIVPAGNVTSRKVTSSTRMRAVKGVIGSKRSASSTACAASSGRSPSSCHCVGVFGEQPDRVRELALGGVDAADQDVQHEVHALHVGEPLARPLRRRSAARSGPRRGCSRRARTSPQAYS